MRYYIYEEPIYDEYGRVIDTQRLYYTRDQLVEQYYFSYCSFLMHKARLLKTEADRSFDAFLEEWKLIHGAWEEEIEEQDNVDKDEG